MLQEALPHAKQRVGLVTSFRATDVSLGARTQCDAFTLDLDGLRPDTYNLRLASLHANGAAATFEIRFGFGGLGKPLVALLNAAWIVDRAERAVMNRQPVARNFLTDQALSSAPTPTSGGERTQWENPRGSFKIRAGGMIRLKLSPPVAIDSPDIPVARGHSIEMHDD